MVSLTVILPADVFDSGDSDTQSETNMDDDNRLGYIIPVARGATLRISHHADSCNRCNVLGGPFYEAL
jgi:hypothetical protein